MQNESHIVVIGGSAAGLTAALTARRHYPHKSVLIIRREQQVPIPCGIPYIFGTLDGPERNLIPDAVLEKNDIDLLVDDATALDLDAKEVHTRAGRTVGYEKLVLATGSTPRRLPVPGSDLEGVYAVHKNVPHLTQMHTAMTDSERVVVVGGGFIGVEFADECNKDGAASVTIVEMLPRCLMLAFDEEFCERAGELLESRGVRLATSRRVERLEGNGRVETVVLGDGQSMEADLVLESVGVQPNSELAERSGLRLGPSGAIGVDRAMRSSDPDVFACGDCAEKVSFFTGEPAPLWLASIATTEARVAGANLYGITRSYPGAIGVYSTVIGDVAFATAGLTESGAREAGFCAVAGRSSSVNRHPGGMPGANNLTLKLLFERQTRVLIGGQLMGARSGGELINTVSACIQQRMTADQIATFQTGTHPALTASPIAYQLVNAAEVAIGAMSG
ncbi:MAG: FAD-dependent oxidoreductase [Candidatus Brocadiia bacterium]